MMYFKNHKIIDTILTQLLYHIDMYTALNYPARQVIQFHLQLTIFILRLVHMAR